jgi:hypothetical protein
MNHLRKHFRHYENTVMEIDTDLRFWEHFLKNAIKQYKLKHSGNDWIFDAVFSMYNIPINRPGRLNISSKTVTKKIADLDFHSNSFFLWVKNISIIRAYNAVEILLLQSIHTIYYPLLGSQINNRKEMQALNKKIKDELASNYIKPDTTNNRHLIEFIKIKSIDANVFLNQAINTDKTSNWLTFFEFMSILRNVIAHHGMIITPNVKNHLSSIAKDLFELYFEQSPDFKSELLKPREEMTHFLGLLDLLNDFAGNTLKFISKESDLKFLGFSQR